MNVYLDATNIKHPQKHKCSFNFEEITYFNLFIIFYWLAGTVVYVFIIISLMQEVVTYNQ